MKELLVDKIGGLVPMQVKYAEVVSTPSRRNVVTIVTDSNDWSQISYQYALGVAGLKVLSDL